MTYLLINNSNNIDTAKMTPLIIEYFRKRNIELLIISSNDELIVSDKIKGIILGGGPVRLTNKIKLNEFITNINAIIQFPNTPILGICFGYQIISISYGGKIMKLSKKKKGINEEITISSKDSILYKNIDSKLLEVYQYHNDYIDKVPNLFTITSVDIENRPQSIENLKLLRFGTQYHPEASDKSNKIIQNFIDFCEELHK